MQRLFDHYIDLRYWNLTRFLRLVFGLICLVAAIVYHNGITGILGGLLFLQGLFDIGCAGGACAVPRDLEQPEKTDHQKPNP